MKALSIRQPWAWCIVEGLKDMENRTWTTSYRGPFFIHASKKFDHNGYIQVQKMGVHLPAIANFQRGGIIGRVNLVDAVRRSDSQWFEGPYGFVLEGAKRLPFVACKGQLGFFQVPKSEGSP